MAKMTITEVKMATLRRAILNAMAVSPEWNSQRALAAGLFAVGLSITDSTKTAPTRTNVDHTLGTLGVTDISLMAYCVNRVLMLHSIKTHSLPTFALAIHWYDAIIQQRVEISAIESPAQSTPNLEKTEDFLKK